MSTTLPEHFEDFAEARREGFLRIKELKDSGKDICGTFCQYTPSEIIRAAGLYQVGLCGQSAAPIKLPMSSRSTSPASAAPSTFRYTLLEAASKPRFGAALNRSPMAKPNPAQK